MKTTAEFTEFIFTNKAIALRFSRFVNYHLLISMLSTAPEGHTVRVYTNGCAEFETKAKRLYNKFIKSL